MNALRQSNNYNFVFMSSIFELQMKDRLPQQSRTSKKDTSYYISGSIVILQMFDNLSTACAFPFCANKRKDHSTLRLYSLL